MSDPTDDHGPGPWVIKNGADTMFRAWEPIGPRWTADPDEALQFYRRRDAEALAAEDEDAWLVVSLAPEWTHLKRGSAYREVGRAELQASKRLREGDTLVIYQSRAGSMYAREVSEFEDGRFEKIES